MCYKPTRIEDRPQRERKDARHEQEARRRRPSTTPRGNGERDRRDMERGAERLEAVLGR